MFVLPFSRMWHSVALLVTGAMATTARPAGAQPTFSEVASEAGIDAAFHSLDLDDPCPAYEFGACAHLVYGGALAAGDYDGDGDIDLYVSRYRARDALYENQGDGTFVDVAEQVGITEELFTMGAVFADLDEDGDQDLFVLTAYEDRFLYYRNLSEDRGDAGTRPSFSEVGREHGLALQGTHPSGGFTPAVGDYDRDGYLDVFIAELSVDDLPCGESRTRLLRNLGAANPGHFEDVTERSHLDLVSLDRESRNYFGATLTDLDRDGWLDLALAGDFDRSRLFWNVGDGTFSSAPHTPSPRGFFAEQLSGMGSAFGDVNGDGSLEWLVTGVYDPVDEEETNRLFFFADDRSIRRGARSLCVQDDGWGWGATFFDFDHDADLDLAAVNGLASFGDPETRIEPNRLFRNDGTVMTEVAEAARFDGLDNGRGLGAIDYDSDGDLDLLVIRNGRSPALYRNNGGNRNDWLKVRAVGTRSNRDGRGAKVRVRIAGESEWQFREIGTGAHFLASEPPIAHFGLGSGVVDANQTVEVEVTFLGGNQVTKGGVSPNQTVTLTEPDQTPPGGVAPLPPIQDCNTNGTPDYCESHCYVDGVPEICMPDAGLGADCDDNGRKDACDIFWGDGTDWNQDQILDACQTGIEPPDGGAPTYAVAEASSCPEPISAFPNPFEPPAEPEGDGGAALPSDGGVLDAGAAGGGGTGSSGGGAGVSEGSGEGGCASARGASRSGRRPLLLMLSSILGFARWRWRLRA